MAAGPLDPTTDSGDGLDSIDPLLHVCVDRPLTDEQRYRSWYEATRERPSNTFPVIQRAALEEPHEPRIDRLGVFVAKHWETGQVLPVAFAPGTSRALIVKLMTMANETGWPGDLRYRDVPRWSDGEIRVAFVAGEGSYSMIGTDCRLVSKADKTLNLGWIDETTDDREVYRTWIHELGHSRGYPHNQSLPDFDVPLRRDYMIRWYMRTQGWTYQQAADQFESISAALLRTSPVNDIRSLMQYPIPAQFVQTGVEVPMNWVLSDEDKRFDLQEVYPPAGTPAPPAPPPAPPITPPPPVAAGTGPLVVGAPPVVASIDSPREVDWYPVTIEAAGVYRFVVEPAMVLGLYDVARSKLQSASTYGPSRKQTDLVMVLDPGSYSLGIKAHTVGGKGSYRVSLAKIA